MDAECIVFVVDNNIMSAFDTLPIKKNLSSMPNISFDGVDIATRLKN